MKKKGLIIALSAIMVVIIAVLGVLVVTGKMNLDYSKKNITVVVVHQQGIEKEFIITTRASNLGKALLQKGIVNQDEYKTGYYTHIDSVRADYTTDRAWWCITKDGEQTTVGANDQPIVDGDKFEITYTPAE